MRWVKNAKKFLTNNADIHGCALPIFQPDPPGYNLLLRLHTSKTCRVLKPQCKAPRRMIQNFVAAQAVATLNIATLP